MIISGVGQLALSPMVLKNPISTLSIIIVPLSIPHWKRLDLAGVLLTRGLTVHLAHHLRPGNRIGIR